MTVKMKRYGVEDGFGLVHWAPSFEKAVQWFEYQYQTSFDSRLHAQVIVTEEVEW